ncbi:MAG: hypothetical protein IPM37_21030 [Hahellaceae bacterium]|nr:hypothetical protein [Hahellaceae bacterium]
MRHALILSSLLFLGSGLISGCATTLERPERITPHQQECVVLLHGLWRSNIAMWPIEEALLEAGYTVVNLDYPSTRASLAELAERHLAPAVTLCENRAQGPGLGGPPPGGGRGGGGFLVKPFSEAPGTGRYAQSA